MRFTFFRMHRFLKKRENLHNNLFFEPKFHAIPLKPVFFSFHFLKYVEANLNCCFFCTECKVGNTKNPQNLSALRRCISAIAKRSFLRPKINKKNYKNTQNDQKCTCQKRKYAKKKPQKTTEKQIKYTKTKLFQ